MKQILQFPLLKLILLILFVQLFLSNGQNSVLSQSSPLSKEKTTRVPPSTDQGEDIIPFKVTNVTVPVIVTDNDDRFITGLTEGNFEIYEDKKRQKIESFQAATDLPLFIAILLDTSGSVKGKLKFEKEATISFLQTILRRRKDHALFLTFDSTVQLRQDFTDDVELLAKAIDKVKASGTTSLYDAVYRICEEKMFNVPTPRKVIIVLSDGADTSSDHTLNQAIEIAQRNEVVIFGISTKGAGFFGVGAGQVLNEDDKELRHLCKATGGDITFPGKVLDLERAFQRYDKWARRYYLLSYEPENPERAGYRKIDIKLVDRKGLTVRAREGYIVAKKSEVKTDMEQK